MNAYTPHDSLVFAFPARIGAAVFLIGLAYQRSAPKTWHVLVAWLIAVASVTATEQFSAHEPPGVRMILIIAVLLWSMKLVVIASARLVGGPDLPASRWLAFLFGWPGMQPAVFAKPAKPNRELASQLLARGLMRIAAGVCLMAVARSLITSPESLPDGDFRAGAATLILLAGVSLVLHFGAFNLLAAFWQAAGINCQPVFRAPLASKSLSEFWSRRWNLAFSEMTAIAVYLPLQARIGPTAAVFAGFAFSGLLHELAITVPVQSGYGGPFGFFVLHGVLTLLERRFDWPKQLGNWYRLVIVVSLIGPLPWLFPSAFLRDIVWPLAGVG